MERALEQIDMACDMPSSPEEEPRMLSMMEALHFISVEPSESPDMARKCCSN